jgi:amino acid transporter
MAANHSHYFLIRHGQAPKLFIKCTKAGVPYVAVLAVSFVTCVTFLVASNNAITVFFWFVELTTTALIAAYSMMLITFICFYRARKAQGLNPQSLPYAAP